MEPSGTQIVPRWDQDGAKRAPRWAKTGLDNAPVLMTMAVPSHPEKPSKKGPQNRSVLDPEIAPKFVKKLINLVFYQVLGPILESLSEEFWGPFWLQDRPRRRQEEPKRANESSKNRKRLFLKKWFSHKTIGIFSLLRPPKTVPRGPEGCPRASRGSSQT